MEFLLFEHISGYALFELKSHEDITASKNTHLYADPARLSQMVQLVSFLRFEDLDSSLSNLGTIAQNIVSDELKNFLILNNVKTIHCDRSLAQALGSLGFKTRQSDIIQRAVRTNQNKLLKISEMDQKRLILSASHGFSRNKIEYNVKMEDNLIIQSSMSMEQLKKDIDSYSKRLVSIYDFYVPELKEVFPQIPDFVRAVKILQNTREGLGAKLDEIERGFGADKKDLLARRLRTTIGNDLDSVDLKNISQIVSILDEKINILADLRAYMSGKLELVAPNLTKLVGDMMAARLIAQVGGLLNLAKCPSSTVQVLGAESALFRSLKAKSPTPKHGFLFESTAVMAANDKNKGRIARFLATKISLACRIDYFSEERSDTYGKKLKKLVEKKIRSFTTNEVVENTSKVLERVAQKLAKLNK